MFYKIRIQRVILFDILPSPANMQTCYYCHDYNISLCDGDCFKTHHTRDMYSNAQCSVTIFYSDWWLTDVLIYFFWLASMRRYMYTEQTSVHLYKWHECIHAHTLHTAYKHHFHSFIWKIYIVLSQEIYSEALPVQPRWKRSVLSSLWSKGV